MRKEFNFKIGADPEFNIIMQGRKVDAQQTLTKILKGLSGFSESNDGYGFNIGKFGALGWDGHDSTGEIRPVPANTADGLIANIKGIFTKFAETCPLFDVSTLSYFGSVGGHIHFSVPPELQTEQKIANIHKKMASLFLPILIGDNKLNLQMRLRGSYGKLSDFRPQIYNKRSGNYDGYEFRSPSAEWLTTEKIALSTIAYAATVYNEIINHPNKIKKLSGIFFRTEKQAEALQMLAMSDYESLTVSLFKKIKKAIKSFEFYPEYKDEIEYILDTEQVIKDKQKAAYNIFNGWGMRGEMTNPTKKQLVSTKTLKKKLENVNMDMMNSLVNISYNNDANVELFKKAIIERTAVYNWRLRNTYYLFGVRKGLNEFLVFDDDGNIITGQKVVKTEEDKKCLSELYCKMRDKFIGGCNGDIYKVGNREIQMMIAGIDPEKESMQRIFIGIPYDVRMKQDVRDFIKIIYDLENKKNITKVPIRDLKVEVPVVTKNKNGVEVIEKVPNGLAGTPLDELNKVSFDRDGYNGRDPLDDLEGIVYNMENDRRRREETEERERQQTGGAGTVIRTTIMPDGRINREEISNLLIRTAAIGVAGIANDGETECDNEDNEVTM